jgi:hypothetical protein
MCQGPTIANIGNTICLFICPHFIIALSPYLQSYRINKKIFRRKWVGFLYRKVVSKILWVFEFYIINGRQPITGLCRKNNLSNMWP